MRPSLPRLLTAVAARLEWMALVSVVWLFRLVPVDAASAAMGWLWRVFAPFNARHKRALRHLEAAMPELTAHERQRIVRGMWDNLGRVAAETFQTDRLLHQRTRFEIDIDAVTEELFAAKGGCVFVSLHSGNWELCVAPAVWQGVPITGVYQALKNPHSDAVLRGLREELYAGGLYSKGHQTARKLVSILRQGGAVAIMSDLRERRGLVVPFFGQQAYATPVPVSLARACNVPIIMGRTVRLDGVRFRIEGRGLILPRTDDKDADIQAGTEAVHAQFEAWIREYPEQWMWIHRKWSA
ncbi:lysophospholipid acyltransferase family protein [Pannonibacter sp. SL95]|uniref:lysophospholipid acyltransferase family protein n=1 Tax=Pannonibacter sp. SL95 TaxID=2995153 RepID=UPI0022754275|nr:lysophospholipid acyltransferase family protein [Pannonibacter sp. SL95]MCY1707457.1 lysophospholipid acyltransferase family protein [Pannonibacter sp. SL95]